MFFQSKRSTHLKLHYTLQAPAPVTPASTSLANTNHMAKVSTNGTGNYSPPIKKEGGKEGKMEAKLSTTTKNLPKLSSLFVLFFLSLGKSNPEISFLSTHG